MDELPGRNFYNNRLVPAMVGAILALAGVLVLGLNPNSKPTVQPLTLYWHVGKYDPPPESTPPVLHPVVGLWYPEDSNVPESAVVVCTNGCSFRYAEPTAGLAKLYDRYPDFWAYEP